MRHEPLLVTVDTNILDQRRVADLVAAMNGRPVEIATVTVSGRERGPIDLELRVLPETALWNESHWDEAVWGGPIPELTVLRETPLGAGVLASELDSEMLERVLTIVSNGSFPRRGERDTLTDPQRRQLRDAMSFEAHCRQGRHVFVSDDRKAFISHGRREKLEELGRTRVLTSAEFIGLAVPSPATDAAFRRPLAGPGVATRP